MTHTSDERSFEEDADGFYTPRCSCGWTFGAPVPDVEIVADALMDHAYLAGGEAALAAVADNR